MHRIIDAILSRFDQLPGWGRVLILALLIGMVIWLYVRRYKLKTDLRAAALDLRERDGKIDAIEKQLAGEQDHRAVAEAKAMGLMDEIGQFRARLEQADQDKQETDKQLAEVEREREALEARFDSLQRLDVDVWARKCQNGDSLPPFVPKENRNTRFLSFLNHKGGVGKTTLVANLGAAFATGVAGKPLSVLLVDLDHQGTLSNNCVDRRPLEFMRTNGFSSARLIDGGTRDDGLLPKLLAPVSGTDDRAKIVVADEHLYAVDFRQQACFAVGQAEVRFLYRQLLHTALVLDQFDLVLFDCPPRLTASSINALMASDYVVIPTALHANDVEAVPRGLQWLGNLGEMAQFRARLAGVIANRTFHTDGTTAKLTVAEQLQFDTLCMTVRKYEPSGNAVLHHTVRRNTEIPVAAAGSCPFGATKKGREFFKDVAMELYERIAP